MLEVRRVFEYIVNGDLDALKQSQKGMPPSYLLKMRQQGLTPLIHACNARNCDIVNYFLNEVGADPSELSKQETALHRAIFQNDYQICKILLDKGANVE